MKLPVLFIIICIGLTSCRPNFGLPVDDQVAVSDMLCECVESMVPHESPYVLDVFQFAVEHPNEDVDEFIEEKRAELDGEALETFNKELSFFYENDIDEIFAVCGEPILNQYPVIDEMDDEVLVKMFLYNLDEGCELTHLLIEVYQAQN
ncbi:MAG: hypothetical protein HWD92_04785 [Flavobacteriia bacterium]|nr:hypothetical protein [Flavobacteriia bacterium]